MPYSKVLLVYMQQKVFYTPLFLCFKFAVCGKLCSEMQNFKMSRFTERDFFDRYGCGMVVADEICGWFGQYTVHHDLSHENHPVAYKLL